MLGLYEDLSKLTNPIRVGVVGTGSIGRGIALQANVIPGTTCVAIANRTIDKAIQWADKLAVPFAVVDTLDAMHDAICDGKLAVCGEGELVASCEYVDVMVESTNAIYAGAVHAMVALQRNKDVVDESRGGPHVRQLPSFDCGASWPNLHRVRW